MQKNRLGQEKSPYLLQHKSNPVHWYPWGDEAFVQARKEDKPIFLSIGYSTCYWCHVMEKESFEASEVASVLNRHFISIKLDREERPDIDTFYMDALQCMTGHGGWPMSMFLAPDGKPFYGATYIPKERFLELLQRIQELWQEDRSGIMESSDKLLEFLQRDREANHPIEFSRSIHQVAVEQLRERFDVSYAGFGKAPKFPPSAQLRFLMRFAHSSSEQEGLEMIERTLLRMFSSGMYDQVGGGFHRYATDDKWLVPHFEKMLYDNALLAITYIEAFQLTQKQVFLQAARGILDYVLAEMTSPEGGFYSAQDAGEVGAEGEFYVWSLSELEQILDSDEMHLLQQYYTLPPNGNFENGSIILELKNPESGVRAAKQAVASVLSKLYAFRSQRVAPHLDDKILVAWNGLMISAFARGASVTGDKRYLTAAQNGATFIQERMFTASKLLRRYREGEARFDGVLADYSYSIQGLIDLYAVNYDSRLLEFAELLQGLQNQIFWDANDNSYFSSSGSDKHLLSRGKEYFDGALPSANAISSLNLLRLSDLSLDPSYRKRGEAVLQTLLSICAKSPLACTSALVALDYFFANSKELVIVPSSEAQSIQELLHHIRKKFYPHLAVVVGEPAEIDDAEALKHLRGKKVVDGKPTFFVCEFGACKMPTNDWNEVLKLIGTN